MLPLVKFVQLVGSVVFDVAHAYCIVLNPEPPVSLAVNVVFIVAFPVVGIIYVPPFGLIVTVGFVLSIPETATVVIFLFPALSSTYIVYVPFCVASNVDKNSVPADAKSLSVFVPASHFLFLIPLALSLVFNVIILDLLLFSASVVNLGFHTVTGSTL